MKTALQLFDFEERPSSSPFIERTWRTTSVPESAFISVAVTHWEVVFTSQEGATRVTVRGPETKATEAPIPSGAEFFGIHFARGAFMPHLPLRGLVNGELTFPRPDARSLWLGDAAWELPDFDDAELFVQGLVRVGILVRDQTVAAALNGNPGDLSERSVQRRILRATGVSARTIKQVQRAERAHEFLRTGTSIAETIWETGYADQAHLTRSLRRYVGQTPAEIVRSIAPEEPARPASGSA